MKIEEQVTSLNLSKELKKLGVKQDSLFFWVEGISGIVDHEPELHNHESLCSIIELSRAKQLKYKEFFSAFTVSELGEFLPEKIKSDDVYTYLKHEKCGEFFRCIYYQKDIDEMYKYLYQSSALKEPDARGRMLEYIIKSNVVSGKKPWE